MSYTVYSSRCLKKSGTQCHAQVTNQMSYTVYSSRCLIREFQTGLREDPESMLYVLLVLMYTLSLVFLSFHLFDLSTTCAAPQSMLWFVLIQWVALAFRTSPVATALLCSLILVFLFHQCRPHCTVHKGSGTPQPCPCASVVLSLL